MSKLISIALALSLACSIARSAQSMPPEDFQTIDPHKNNQIRIDPGAAWPDYTTFVVAPAVYEPSSPARSVTQRQAEKLRSAVDTGLQAAFVNTTNSQARVLEIRPVITDARRSNPYLNAISFVAIQAAVSYGAASVRYDLYDAATGRRIGEITTKRSALGTSIPGPSCNPFNQSATPARSSSATPASSVRTSTASLPYRE